MSDELERLYESVGLQRTPETDQAIDKALAQLDINDPKGLGRFGDECVSSTSVGDLSIQYNEINSNVSNQISGIVTILRQADPAVASKREGKPSLWGRMTGRKSLDQLEYLTASRQVDERLKKVPEMIDSLEALLDDIKAIENQIHQQQHGLKIHIIAGQRFMQTLTPEQQSGSGPFGERAPGDRIGGRVTQLATLLTTNDQTLRQIKLVEQNSLSLLDHLNRIMTVTVPAWHARRMAIQLGDQDYEGLQQATESHQELLDELNTVKDEAS